MHRCKYCDDLRTIWLLLLNVELQGQSNNHTIILTDLYFVLYQMPIEITVLSYKSKFKQILNFLSSKFLLRLYYFANRGNPSLLQQWFCFRRFE